jgi:hypothetical protein
MVLNPCWANPTRRPSATDSSSHVEPGLSNWENRVLETTLSSAKTTVTGVTRLCSVSVSHPLIACECGMHGALCSCNLRRPWAAPGSRANCRFVRNRPERILRLHTTWLHCHARVSHRLPGGRERNKILGQRTADLRWSVSNRIALQFSQTCRLFLINRYRGTRSVVPNAPQPNGQEVRFPERPQLVSAHSHRQHRSHNDRRTEQLHRKHAHRRSDDRLLRVLRLRWEHRQLHHRHLR